MTTKVLKIIGDCVVPVLALAFSWYIYCDSSYRRAEDKRVDAVAELVSYIQSHPFSAVVTSTIITDTASMFVQSTLFSFPDSVVIPKTKNGRLFFHNGDTWPFDLSAFANNPFMPKGIAEQLRKFEPTGGLEDNLFFLKSFQGGMLICEHLKESEITAVQYDLSGEKHNKVTRSTYSGLPADTAVCYMMPSTPAFESVGKFNTCCRDLYKSITDWLEKEGLGDINLRK